jgi:hypothetical protein
LPEPDVLPHPNIPTQAVGAGEKNPRTNKESTPAVLADGEAFGAGVVGALDHVAALLASVERTAPTSSLARFA